MKIFEILSESQQYKDVDQLLREVNVFADLGLVPGAEDAALSVYDDEYARNPDWQRVEAYYKPIAGALVVKLQKYFHNMTPEESEAVIDTVYDGSDGYNDLSEIPFLANLYQDQIETIIKIIRRYESRVAAAHNAAVGAGSRPTIH